MQDLQSRLTGRVQLSTDGMLTYPEAVERAFGRDVDYAQLIKTFDSDDGRPRFIRKVPIAGNPDLNLTETSYIERHNLTTRMSVRRFTRLTNAFSKTITNHRRALALYFVWYNFCRHHSSIRATPAMAAGLAEYPRGFDWICELINERAPALAPREGGGSSSFQGIREEGNMAMRTTDRETGTKRAAIYSRVSDKSQDTEE